MPQKFSTHLLDRAIARSQEERERQRLDKLAATFKALNQLATQVSFHECYLFGSLIKPDKFRPGSDIDIGFMGLKDEDFFSAMSFLSRELGVEVDVFQLEQHRLKDKVTSEGMKWNRKD